MINNNIEEYIIYLGNINIKESLYLYYYKSKYYFNLFYYNYNCNI